jgi:hypothetical protein
VSTPLRAKAIRKLAATCGMRDPEIVDLVLDTLSEPDAEMLAAGEQELATAFGPGSDKAYRRRLAAVIWRSMLFRVRA